MASYITIKPNVTTMEAISRHYSLINKDSNEAVFGDICKNPELFRDNLICYLSGRDECLVLARNPISL
jgi:hypothetical protein